MFSLPEHLILDLKSIHPDIFNASYTCLITFYVNLKKSFCVLEYLVWLLPFLLVSLGIRQNKTNFKNPEAIAGELRGV